MGVTRKNQQALTWLRAALIAAVTWLAMNAMLVRPTWLSIVFAMVAGGLALLATDLGVLAAVVAVSIPLMAAQPLLGIGALALGIIAVRYLGADGGRAFLVIAISLVGAFVGPVWAGAALAGYLLGAGEGALAAAVACVVVEIVGVMLGRPTIGVTVTGGPTTALVNFAHMPATMLSAEWLRVAFANLGAESVNRVVNGIAGISQPVALVVQPGLWALGAAVAGVGARVRRGKRLYVGLASVSLGVLVPAVGNAIMRAFLGLPSALTATAIAALASLAVALAFVAVWESVFPPIRVVAPPAARRVSMTTEDADVDELLRLISTAEDKLASQHTTTKVVMITDMKSFSRMTEEDGSVLTAKAIQRHRDLLLPIVEKAGGSGKSTGGDGLVAAFQTADAGISAAAAMQRALAENNAAHPNEREIWIRIGIASGEVVLDRGGRPFIGNALNLAARIMNLADGGQVFSTGEVAQGSRVPDVRLASFGDFELKNIAKPVEVIEVLWQPGQEPHDPRSAGADVEE